MYHTISNLYIDSDEYGAVGMFTAITETSTIKKLIIENVNITNRYEKNVGSAYAGGIVGTNNGYITNCGIENGGIKILRTTALRTYDDIAVGGICGLTTGSINECYNKAEIYAEHDTRRSSQLNAGGICGMSTKKEIGGYAYVDIANCYNSGEVTYTGGSNGYISVGSILGVVYQDRSTISDCYSSYNISLIGARRALSGGSTSITSNCCYTEEDVNVLKTDCSKLGDAFVEDTKGINSGYPILAWELEKIK